LYKEVKAERHTSVMMRLGGDTLHRCDDESCISADDFTAGAIAVKLGPGRFLKTNTRCAL